VRWLGLLSSSSIGKHAVEPALDCADHGRERIATPHDPVDRVADRRAAAPLELERQRDRVLTAHPDIGGGYAAASVSVRNIAATSR
jgi:hypothetical protein